MYIHKTETGSQKLTVTKACEGDRWGTGLTDTHYYT